MTQGERVKAIRKSLNLTLEKFGEKLGIQKSAVSKIERGDVVPTEQTVRAICREYNVNYDWLISEEGDMFTDLPSTILDELCRQHDLDSFDRSLIELYLDLPADFRKLLKDRLRDMVQKEKD